MPTRNYDNHFENIATIDAPRSKFKMDKKHLTTFNVGDLIPFYSKLVYPGDTVSIKTNYVVRTTTPIKAPMDISYLDTYYFFVPMRLVWEHWKEFMGENKLTPWEQKTEYTIPQITAPEGGWKYKTLADHFGLPPKIGNISVTALKFRAYALIYNEWFRNQNLQNGLMVNTDDATVVGSNGNNTINDAQLGGMPAKVCKFHDYFTSLLPEPQKGPDVLLPLGTTAPVIGDGNTVTFTNGYGNFGLSVLSESTTNYYATLNTGTAGKPQNTQGSELAGGYAPASYGLAKQNSGMVADLSKATASTIIQLRQAFAIQQLYELDARAGTRYTEIVKAHFGVTSSDARMQRPEYLGGSRNPMSITQVVQTSGTTETSEQGNIAGYSLTANTNDDVTYSSEEHGYIIGLTCVRCNHTYQQGIAREDSYKDKLDFYWPTLDSIGDQAVLNKEIFAQGNDKDNEVFGYSERYIEARTDFNTLSGEFRDGYETSLKAWQYADNYSELPTLSEGWIKESEVNMDKTLQVTSKVSDQIHADFYIDATYVRRMAMYAIPGLDRM